MFDRCETRCYRLLFLGLVCLTNVCNAQGQQFGRPDRSDHAPHSPGRLIPPAATGDTHISFDPDARKATLRVEDGWDLDRYLFFESSPLDFRIDLYGLEPHPSKPAKVTLRVFDVDQSGHPDFPECQVEVDQVSLNGHFIGNLTGANDQWSTVSFSIPPGILVSGVNQFNIQIDTLTNDCWAVEVDWAEVEIPFNIAQVGASALSDVTIRRGSSDEVITDPIWKTGFDSLGNVVVNPSKDDPIADKIKGFFSFGAREFKYRYTLETWPGGVQSDWQPTVRYDWSFSDTGQNSDGFQEVIGWEEDIKITLPDKIGKYTLNLTLKVYHQNTLLLTEQRSHTVYVLLDNPIGLGKVAKTTWLDTALDWAGNQGDEESILQALNTVEYDNPLGWRYGYPKVSSPATLIENGAGRNGDCYVFRDVWRLLASSLGIGVGATSYVPGKPYLTGTRPALDDNDSANARNKASDTRDRWSFSNHQYGKYGGKFYDPTFGLIGSNTTTAKEEAVYCKITASQNSQYLCTSIHSDQADARIDSPVGTINGWPLVEYQIQPTVSPNFLAAAVSTDPFGLAVDYGHDPDGNSLYEQLRLDLPVQIAQGGRFGIVSNLSTTDGTLLAIGSLDAQLKRNAPQTTVELTPGSHTLSIYFNGRALRESGSGGPYQITTYLIDDQGQDLASTTHTTAAYPHTAFQGTLVNVLSIVDTGVNDDGISGFDWLRVSPRIEMAAGGEIHIQGQLFADSKLVGEIDRTLELATGIHTLNLDFPGQGIALSTEDGPYQVYLSFDDNHYTVDASHTTSAYGYGTFQPPAVFFTGEVDESTTDSNGNGLYDNLTLRPQVFALAAGTYVVNGILEDGDGNLIATAEQTLLLNAGSAAVAGLEFDGRSVHHHGSNGSFRAVLALTDAPGRLHENLMRSTAHKVHRLLLGFSCLTYCKIRYLFLPTRRLL